MKSIAVIVSIILLVVLSESSAIVDSDGSSQQPRITFSLLQKLHGQFAKALLNPPTKNDKTLNELHLSAKLLACEQVELAKAVNKANLDINRFAFVYMISMADPNLEIMVNP